MKIFFKVLSITILTGMLGLLAIGFTSIEKRTAVASEQKVDQPISRSLSAASATERKRIVNQYIAMRSSEAKGILEVIESSAKQLRSTQRVGVNDVEYYAAKLVSEIRNPIAIPACHKLLAVRDSTFSPISNESDPHWDHFPFAVATSHIGMPAVVPLLNQIQSTAPSSTEFHVGCVTLEKILGRELAEATLKQRAKQVPDRGQAGWLQDAMNLVKIGHSDWDATSADDFRSE